MGLFSFFSKKNSNAPVAEEKKAEPVEVTKEYVAERIAKAWRETNTVLFSKYLDEDVEFRSCATTKKYKGKKEYLDYVKDKFKTQAERRAQYITEVVDLEGEIAVKIDVAEEDYPSAYLVFTFEDEKIKTMLMRPEKMYQIEDLNNQELVGEILTKVIEKVQKGLQLKAESLGFNVAKDFEWLQQHPSFNTPQFQHLCFRLGKSVFSLRLFVTDMENRFVELNNTKEEIQLAVCKENDLVPCMVAMDINAVKEPQVIHSETKEPIDFKALAENGNDVMSAWELNHYAVYYVLTQLSRQGVKGFYFTDAPGIVPQIHYEEDGKHAYVYVCGHLSSDKNAPVHKEICDKYNDATGYYADVPLSFFLGNDGNTKGILRGAGGGNNMAFPTVTPDKPLLMPIEEAYEKFGIFEGE